MLLRVSIYKDQGGDCSNGGLSSKGDACMLSTDPENDPVDGCRLPVVVLGQTVPGYKVATPIEPVESGSVGYMAGGCFIYTSDSRFPSDTPIPLHDRTETVELYASFD